jgi:hypothetical protein
MYTQHKYQSNHIWNLDETCVQTKQQSNVKVLARWGSWDVYNTILNSHEWLIVNFVVNATNVAFPTFYIFIGSRMQKDYIKLCRLKTCMTMQKKTWMITYLLK